MHVNGARPSYTSRNDGTAAIQVVERIHGSDFEDSDDDFEVYLDNESKEDICDRPRGNVV